MPVPVMAAAALAKAAPIIASAVAKAVPAVAGSAIASGVAKAAPTLAKAASKVGLPTLASWADKLNKSGALSSLNTNMLKNGIGVASEGLRRAVAGNPVKKGGMKISKNNVGKSLDGIISANGLPYLGMGNSSRFINRAVDVFLSSYLPQALSQGELEETELGQLLLPFMELAEDGQFLFPFMEDGSGSGAPTFSAFAGHNASGGVDSGDLSDYYRGSEQGSYGGNGGVDTEALLSYYLGGEQGSEDNKAESAKQRNNNPFAEQDAEMEWRRKQQEKQAGLERRLQKRNQKWIEERMDKYYRKKKLQWLKEKGLEAVGAIAATAGQSANVYNSLLANALMQSAASSMTRAQAEKYGNPLLPGTQLYAGGRMAGGQIANVIGQNVGEFLKNWGQDIAGEFERMRGLRIQMDVSPSGRAMDAIYKLGRYYGRNTHTEGKGYV